MITPLSITQIRVSTCLTLVTTSYSNNEITSFQPDLTLCLLHLGDHKLRTHASGGTGLDGRNWYRRYKPRKQRWWFFNTKPLCGLFRNRLQERLQQWSDGDVLLLQWFWTPLKLPQPFLINSYPSSNMRSVVSHEIQASVMETP